MSRRRRRNPTIQATLKKIPFVGGTLAAMVDFLPQALFGAVSVEPTIMVAKFLSPYMPQMPASVFYGATGLLVASLVRFIPGLTKSTKDKLAIAVASAAGGVAYYKMRTGSDTEMASEAGMLELRGVGNLGGLLQVRPYAGMSAGHQTMFAGHGGHHHGGHYGLHSAGGVVSNPAGYGAYPYQVMTGGSPFSGPIAGTLGLHYGDASLVDALAVGNDLDQHEINAIANGSWDFAFQPASSLVGAAAGNGMSRHAGKPGHRWGWLIKLIGEDSFRALAALPPKHQITIINQTKTTTQQTIVEALPSPSGGGYGALVYGH